VQASPRPLSSPQRDPEFGSQVEYRDHTHALIAPERYLRILANPFLALAGMVGWVWLLIRAFGKLRANPDLMGPLAPIIVVLLVAIWLGVIPRLFQFHCLDCGTTGRMARWREHICRESTVRRLAGRPRWLRGPTPFFQCILWMWLALAFLWLAHDLWT
jgi:hypothetical protein